MLLTLEISHLTEKYIPQTSPNLIHKWAMTVLYNAHVPLALQLTYNFKQLVEEEQWMSLFPLFQHAYTKLIMIMFSILTRGFPECIVPLRQAKRAHWKKLVMLNSLAIISWWKQWTCLIM